MQQSPADLLLGFHIKPVVYICPVNTTTMQVSAIKIAKNLEAGFLRQFIDKVQVSKQNRIAACYKLHDAYLTLFSDLLVRMLAIKYYGCKNTDIAFSASAFGKPAFSGCAPFHFNVSHSGEWIVCASDVHEVGIDTEQISEMDLSISEMFFHAAEHEDIIYSIDPDSQFFTYWTLKESYVKYTGTGLYQPLNSFCIKFLNGNKISIEVDSMLVSNMHLKCYDIAEGYKTAVCSGQDQFPDNITLYTVEDVTGVMTGSEGFN